MVALSFLSSPLYAQFTPIREIDMGGGDFSLGGDIFNDFNEEIDDVRVLEDERFYRHGRFFSAHFALGLTTFDGNRGRAYENDPPAYGFGLTYFQDFQNAFGMGFEFSRHHMFFPDPTRRFQAGPPLFIVVSQLRVYFSYRYYIDTSDLGTAITWSNPYFIGRLEYWYTTNKYQDLQNVPNDSGGGIGIGLGFGLEFPIVLKESYISVEFKAHIVNFTDKYTRDFAKPEDDSIESRVNFPDLAGNAYSTMVAYVISW